jgi:hypothetical protein
MSVSWSQKKLNPHLFGHPGAKLCRLAAAKQIGLRNPHSIKLRALESVGKAARGGNK